MRRLTASSFVVVLLTGCATAPPRPSVYTAPTRGQSYEQMAQDTTTCEAWARQQTGFDPVAETTKGAVVGTLLGGAIGAGGGAALGAASGGHAGRGAATGAVVGGIVGGVAGGAIQYSQSKEGFDRAYAACMSGRGYSTGPAMAIAAPPPPPPAPVVVAPPPPPVVVVQQPPTVVVATPPAVVVEPRHVHVPVGHYPPPGYCRIWYPSLPPGQQPKPVLCRQMVAVPAGTFVLYNGVAYDADYDWRSHARRQPGSVPSVIVELNVRR